jgi:hypothetical protein
MRCSLRIRRDWAACLLIMAARLPMRVSTAGMRARRDFAFVKRMLHQGVQTLPQEGNAAKKGRKCRAKQAWRQSQHKTKTAKRLAKRGKLWRSDQK